jgi:DMSO/TMAO reductase YedYZ heme-binding membrane subunit
MKKINRYSPLCCHHSLGNENSFSFRSLRSTIIFASLAVSLLLIGFVNAQVDTTKSVSVVDYNGQEAWDSDLDGLTDQAEVQIYKTDVAKADTDSDGYFDGTEVLANSDPSDASSTPVTIQNKTEDTVSVQEANPWPWYFSRAIGLVAFALLYISIFLVLTIRIPLLHKIFAPVHALNAHGWIALQATILALAHGMVLIFDKFLNFTPKSVLIPFTSTYEKTFVALGTISLYLMLLLVITSYGRKYLSFKVWRTIHFFNIGLYFIVLIHALYLGTDLKIVLVRNIFIAANGILIILMLVNMFLRIRQNIAAKNSITPLI